MMFYRLVSVNDGAPYTAGAVGLRRGEAAIAERVEDDEATRRGLEDSAGFPLPGWIWHPVGNLNPDLTNR